MGIIIILYKEKPKQESFKEIVKVTSIENGGEYSETVFGDHVFSLAYIPFFERK